VAIENEVLFHLLHRHAVEVGTQLRMESILQVDVVANAIQHLNHELVTILNISGMHC